MKKDNKKIAVIVGIVLLVVVMANSNKKEAYVSNEPTTIEEFDLETIKSIFGTEHCAMPNYVGGKFIECIFLPDGYMDEPDESDAVAAIEIHDLKSFADIPHDTARELLYNLGVSYGYPVMIDLTDEVGYVESYKGVDLYERVESKDLGEGIITVNYAYLGTNMFVTSTWIEGGEGKVTTALYNYVDHYYSGFEGTITSTSTTMTITPTTTTHYTPPTTTTTLYNGPSYPATCMDNEPEDVLTYDWSNYETNTGKHVYDGSFFGDYGISILPGELETLTEVDIEEYGFMIVMTIPGSELQGYSSGMEIYTELSSQDYFKQVSTYKGVKVYEVWEKYTVFEGIDPQTGQAITTEVDQHVCEQVAEGVSDVCRYTVQSNNLVYYSSENLAGIYEYIDEFGSCSGGLSTPGSGGDSNLILFAIIGGAILLLVMAMKK